MMPILPDVTTVTEASDASKKNIARDIFGIVTVKAKDQDKSYRWYRDNVRKLATGITGANILNADKFSKTASIGNMFLFIYDPKHKDILPMYDTVPLVLPFRSVPGGFLGLNLHYLPYPIRFKMIGELMSLSTDKVYNEKTKINLSWRLIESTARLAPVKICVKHYLAAQVKSRFLKIPFTDWKTAVMLPVQNFVYNK